MVDDPMGDKLLMVMEYVDGGALMPGETSGPRTTVTEATARKHFRDVLKVGTMSIHCLMHLAMFALPCVAETADGTFNKCSSLVVLSPLGC